FLGRRARAARGTPRSGGALADDLARRLVLAQPLPRGMTQAAVGRPLGELDLPDQLRVNPVRLRRILRPLHEWTRRRSERLQPTAQLDGDAPGEARADFADGDERAVVV